MSTSPFPTANDGSLTSTAESTGGFASNRIFVSGLKESFHKEELEQEFSKYGSIQSIQVIDYENRHKKSSKRKKREPFAFITFENEEVAIDIVSKFQNNLGSDNASKSKETGDRLFSIVKYANPLVKRHAKRVRKSLNEQEQILEIFQKEQKPKLLIQVHSSHLARMEQYITDLSKECSEHPSPIPIYLGCSSSKSKNISFIFLYTPEEDSKRSTAKSYWYNHFITNARLVRFGIRKVYAVDHIVHIPATKQNEIERAKLLVDCALDGLEKDLSESNNLDCNDIVMRAQTFPAKYDNLQHQVVATLDRQIDDFEKRGDSSSSKHPTLNQRKLSMSSTDYTHIFSCVQIFNPRNHAKMTDKCTVDEIFMVGISHLTPTKEASSIPILGIGDKHDTGKEICRAYFKLKEAMDNYRKDEKEITLDFQGLDAFDCGSSPGGWTKYLIETEKCATCWSCDPGALDDSVKTMSGIKHLQMKGYDAIDLLQKKGKKVNLWVSDMCLVDPKQQVSSFL